MKKNSLWRPAGVLLTIVAFLVLSVIAAVEYSGSEEGSNRAREGFIYQSGALALRTGEKIFAGLASPRLKKEEAVVIEEEYVEKGLSRYIKLEKQEKSWLLTLQNSRGLIWQKTWPRLFKR